MAEDRHPDLETFYESLDPDEQEALLEEDVDDGDYEYFLDPDDIDDEDIEDDDDDDEYVDEEEDGGEGEADEDMGDTNLLDDVNIASALETDQDGTTFLNIAALLNSAAGGNAQARQSLLTRLLAGPTSSGGGANTRSGGGLMRGLRSAIGPTVTPEERARLAAERREKERFWEPQRGPNPRGLELLQSGEFGKVGDWRCKGGRRRPAAWESRRRTRQYVPVPAKATIPNSNGTVVASYPSVPYVGQYAGEDYSLFYAATQYFTLHLYSTNQARPTARKSREQVVSPRPTPMPGSLQTQTPEDEEDEDDDHPWGNWGSGRRGMAQEDTSMKKIKNVQGVEGSWTITDCDADTKGAKIIYSSITPYVHMLYTAEDDSEHIQLNFSSTRRGREGVWGSDNIGIWSIRFSADGKEVVAGASSGQIMTYDIEAQRRSLSIMGHSDDVNAVCFADESSTNILVSGSDDGYVKVWDRRSLSSSTPSGVLVGATEGITYTSPKGDGRYIVVNSKDQAARLYDLRKMRSHSEFEGEPDAVSRYGQPRYDYRRSRYPKPARMAHPKDCSIMTYRGHSVLRTLIRCHFSPRESTGQSYIFSGSADGMIHIWSLDGQVVQVLNRAESVPLKSPAGEYNDPSAPERERRHHRYGAQPYEDGQQWTVRDVAWHGYEPTLMSTCWEVEGGYRRGGTLAKHEWKGLGKGGLRRLEDWVEKKQLESEEMEM